MLPLGTLANVSATIIGALLGIYLGRRIPPHIHKNLPSIFGLIALALAIPIIADVAYLPAVTLAIVIGTIIGETFRLERWIHQAALRLQRPIERIFPSQIDAERDNERYINQFISVLVLFTIGGLGVFGAITEGITGDSTLLLTKAILDLFTAFIFGTSLGYMMLLVAIPQGVLQLTLFFLAGLIVPYISDTMLRDFAACGGVIMLATGCRMAEIKDFPLMSMLPALLLIFPISHYWGMIF